MKYMLMFIRNDDAFLGDSKVEANYADIDRWFGELGQQGKLQGGEELQPSQNATTVRWTSDKPVVTDGPFMEAKEHIAGFALVEATDLDEAIAIASGWPEHGHALEIRPVADHDSH